jgi:hypothetical protein
MSTSLKFFVKENGTDFPISHMTEPETAAIEECVDDLIPSEHKFVSYWFEADTCILPEGDEEEDDDFEEPAYGLLKCYTHHPNPKSFSIAGSRIPHPIPSDLLKQLAGKTFRVNPRQLGVNPWGAKVEITFEDVAVPAPSTSVSAPLPAPAPAPAPAQPSVVSLPPAKGGIKISELIGLALKAK